MDNLQPDIWIRVKIQLDDIGKTMFRLATLLITSISASIALADVNVYSSRKEVLILPLLDRFTEQTGIEVNLLTGDNDALLSRLQRERSASPADLLITVDVARLHRAKEMGLTQPVQSDILESKIASQWRDSDNHWFGLTSRARPIIYAKNRVEPNEFDRYEDLADPKWKGRICMRSSDNVYNQSLVSSALIANGSEETQTWLNGLVKNFARPPAGGDTDQLRAVAAGMCDLTLANTYYLGRLARSEKGMDQMVASQLAVFWPNQSDRGAHFNISGIALTQSSKNRDEALKLMEFMVSEESQRWYADVNNEYPVVEGVQIPEVLADFGQPKADSVALSKLGELNSESLRLMDQAGWK